jgi:hypothetical protein
MTKKTCNTAAKWGSGERGSFGDLGARSLQHDVQATSWGCLTPYRPHGPGYSAPK